MFEVFKTNVHSHHAAGELLAALRSLMPCGRINFDLQDCDRILRVESGAVEPASIVALLQAFGYCCEALE